jgi:polar amino acid transport system substrate-binding protein
MFMLLSTFAFAQSYKVAVAQFPGTGEMSKLIAAIGEAMNAKVDIQVVPLARVTYLIETKQVDITMPMIRLKDPDQIKQLKYDYSTATFGSSPFVLYTNKNKPVDIANLKNGNSKGYKIETDTDNIKMFGFTALGSTNTEASLKKVNDGLIDGYILAPLIVDPILKNLKLTKIKRQFYDFFDLGFTLQKGGQGGPVDKFLTEGMKRVRDSGKYDEIMGYVNRLQGYDDWQP